MYPSLAQFTRWAAHYNAVPMWIEPQLPTQDLMEWAHTLVGAQQKFFFFNSASATRPAPGTTDEPPAMTGRQARYSAVALDTPRYTADVQDGSLFVRYHGDHGGRSEALKVGNPYVRFHEWLSQWSAPRVDHLPPFWGGAFGYFGYDSATTVNPDLLKKAKATGRRAPASADKKPALAVERFSDFEFSLYDAVAVVDHARSRLWLVNTVFLPKGRSLSPQQLERLYRQSQDRLRRYAVKLQQALHHRRAWGQFRASNVRSNLSEAAYRLLVRRAKGLIGSGDIYQCNLSQILSASWEGDPWSLYQQLAQINPSPYAGLWRSGPRWMVSASPELLVRQEDDHVETRPIAGTYPRVSGGSDQKTLHNLVRDAKERAEHIMLVDLERNDLGRVCKTESIKVAESLVAELYSHVVHLVSDIRGTLKPGLRWPETLKALFPGGTITGCPKVRSMEAIQKLEPQRRGPYTGSLGWIGFSGDATFNILIRTFFLDQGRMCFPVGAGIVADSDPSREYHETLHKAEALLQSLQSLGTLKPGPRKSS